MKCICLSLPLWLGLVLVAGAQPEVPKPAPELAKFDIMLGNWTGSGTVRMTPDAEKMPWTSVTTARKILDGHFIQVDTSIQVGGPVPMLFREIYGWDRERRTYVGFECGNAMPGATSDVYFTADGKLVSSSTRLEKGKVVTDRWVTTFEKDSHSFQGFQAIDGGEFFLHVEGTAKRGGDGFTLTAANSGGALEPAGDTLEPFEKMIGTWSYTGWVKMAPGAEPTAIGGREVIEKFLGGHIVMASVVDEKTPYRGRSYMYWDPGENCHMVFGVNNMGEMHAARTYCPTEERIVMVFAGALRGEPVCGLHTSTFTGDKVAGKSYMLKDGKSTQSLEINLVRAKP